MAAGTIELENNALAQTTTPDATPVNVDYSILRSNTGGCFRLRVSARNTATNKTANTTIVFGAQNAAGTVAILGTPTVLLTIANGSDAAMLTVTVGLSGSGGNIRVTLTGIAATSIEWHLSLEGLMG